MKLFCNQIVIMHCLAFHSRFKFFFFFKQEVALKNRQECYAPPPPPQFYSSLIEEIGTLGWDKYVYSKMFQKFFFLFTHFSLFAVLAIYFVPVFSQNVSL